MRKARSRARPCPPGKEGPPAERGRCSFPGRKETGRRMSGSGCWRVSGRASPSPIGKHRRCRPGGHRGAIVGMAVFAVGRKQMGLFAPVLLILNVGRSRPQKCPVLATPPVRVMVELFFSPLSEGRIEVSIEVTFSSFSNPVSFLCFFSPHSLFSAQSTKRAYPLESARPSPAERAGRHHLWGGSNGHPRTAPRAHPFTQDPAMPPLTPPNTLAQLEEACRRLAEVSKPPKQR